MEKFVIAPKEERTVTMTIRVDKDIQKQYTALSDQTGHSRNELINMALQFALDHMEIRQEK